MVGLVFSTAWTVAHQAFGARATVLAVAGALLAWRTRAHVVVLVAAGAAAGALGWI